MNFMLPIAISAAKLNVKLCRILKKGGTTFPGVLARKIYPKVLDDISKNFTTIAITGTNGKTTTTTIISKILENNSIKYITNTSGANLEGGITAAFIDGVNIFGKPKNATFAVIETDEAAFRIVAPKIKPKYIIVTNFFKDQLDRFGEVNTTLSFIKEGISKNKDSVLVLNADDHRCASLGQNVENKVIYYGVAKSDKINNDDDISNQSNYCIFCKNKYEFDYTIYGHMGGFSCPNCGYKRPMPNIEVNKIISLNSNHSEVIIKNLDNNLESAVTINLPGLYNIYNALAAYAFSYAMNLNPENSIKALSAFNPKFGRMESLNIGSNIVKIILVKNPAGFNEVLNLICNDESNIRIMFVINDFAADGEDISWLFDVNFEKLKSIDKNVIEYYTSGTRSHDMALRLKYAEIESDKISVLSNGINNDIEYVLNNLKDNEKLYILPTYTSMLKVRQALKEKFKMKDFWE